METPNPGNWSELPLDIVRSLFERLSFVDFQRVKIVCSNWFSCSKHTVPRKSGSPWLMLTPEDGGYVLYNPDEDKIYRSLRDFSGSRFLANSGKWFLVADSRTNLYIIDLFSEKRIDLPPLESLLSSTSSIKRVGDGEFERKSTARVSHLTLRADILRGLLWVDEKTEEFVVVWFFDTPASYLSFCKNGDLNYTDIPMLSGVPKLLQGVYDLVLRGYCLYISTTRRYIRVLDLSGQKGFVDITGRNPYQMLSPHRGYLSRSSIAVTTAGEVLLVESIIIGMNMIFKIYKRDPDEYSDGYYRELLEVDSLGDETLLLDLGITVPADHTLGLKPGSIYFTRHDRACLRKPYDLDICVGNLATQTLTRFGALTKMNLKDARWFLSGT